MDQVQPVADPAERDERASTKQRRARNGDRAEHEGNVDEPEQSEAMTQPTLIEPSETPQRNEHGRRRADERGAAPTTHRRHACRRDQARGDGTDQQLDGARIGPQVDTIERRARQDERRRDTGAGQCDQHAEQPPATAAQGDHGNDRQHQVALLFDGQRPQMTQRRRQREQLGVGTMGGDEAPVGNLGERGAHITRQ